jgi:hypothetical protein
MEYVVDHFQNNSQLYKTGFDYLSKATVGIVMAGISLGCIHLIIFLIQILRLPKNST